MPRVSELLCHQLGYRPRALSKLLTPTSSYFVLHVQAGYGYKLDVRLSTTAISWGQLESSQINFAAAIASLHHRYAFVGVLSRTPLDLPRIAVLLNQAHARPHGKQIPLAPGQLSFEQARRERCVDRSGWGPHGQCPMQRGQLQNG